MLKIHAIVIRVTLSQNNGQFFIILYYKQAHKRAKRRQFMIIRILLGAAIGGFLGFLYSKKIGCKTGTCPITSSKKGSAIYGAILGIMISSYF